MDVFRELVPSSSYSTSSFASSTAAEPAATPALELEHMFDKVVTPSDVGKLNRLVIPKQHAEKHFPLDPASADKGVLLCFEERDAAVGAARDGGGKQWQFRYSYWNSSQSYVMTKGWSRYVKDKQLDSGDTVSFSRSASGRLFIDCQRRRQHLVRRYPLPVARWGRFFPPSMRPPTYNSYAGAMWRSYFQAGPQARVPMGGGSAAEPPLVLESVPVLHHVAEPKRVRLFGVDLECAEAETSTSTPADLHLVLAPKPPFLSGGKEKVEEGHGSRQWTT